MTDTDTAVSRDIAIYHDLRAACLEVFERHGIAKEEKADPLRVYEHWRAVSRALFEACGIAPENIDMAGMLPYAKVQSMVLRENIKRRIACCEKIEAVYCAVKQETGLSRSEIVKIRRGER